MSTFIKDFKDGTFEHDSGADVCATAAARRVHASAPSCSSPAAASSTTTSRSYRLPLPRLGSIFGPSPRSSPRSSVEASPRLEAERAQLPAVPMLGDTYMADLADLELGLPQLCQDRGAPVRAAPKDDGDSDSDAALATWEQVARATAPRPRAMDSPSSSPSLFTLNNPRAHSLG